MPTQHIKDETWRKVTELTVDAVIKSRKSIKASKVLDLIIQKGLDNLSIREVVLLAEKCGSPHQSTGVTGTRTRKDKDQ